MCNACCAQFRGWCKAFTRTEVYLSLAQAALLAGFIAFLIFLTLHFIACSKKDISRYSTTEFITSHEIQEFESSTKSLFITSQKKSPKNLDCTWNPLHTTDAATHFTKNVKTVPTDHFEHKNYADQKPKMKEIRDSDGIIDTNRKDFILALVKIKPPLNLVFGCILTVVNKFWSLTAASCIESIEEVDSLDSFVIMENFGEIKQGPVHSVSDINLHPLYQGTNKSYDLTAIKSEDKIDIAKVAQLPKALDYLLINLGEGLNILGFGKFRSIDKISISRGVRSVSINIVPLVRCESGDDMWSLRHLSRGEAVPRSECEAVGRPICAAPPRESNGTCNYCAGAPLLRDKILLGIMSDNKHCGLSCEPNLYVNLAAMRDWLDSVINLE
ncbi:atrial natriuretic peptide-converting enzyme-like [Pieris rapae]|uniref:atrial natriuretic peptide-converting enzyme-like n=1 Tax=Pieris rapae TaxID=64459 RepID=UPI001E2811D9|nr:atrial natriuretic peptide-converting enzyme-like [Pieris rapae]